MGFEYTQIIGALLILGTGIGYDCYRAQKGKIDQNDDGL